MKKLLALAIAVTILNVGMTSSVYANNPGCSGDKCPAVNSANPPSDPDRPQQEENKPRHKPKHDRKPPPQEPERSQPESQTSHHKPKHDRKSPPQDSNNQHHPEETQHTPSQG